MKRTHLTTLAAAGLYAAAVFAGDLSKYKGWERSPLGDLMTARERRQWADVKSDAAAEEFVKDFLAKRGPEFVVEVKQAAAAADRYFTVGNIPGSLTARGRLVIILGPPGSVSATERRVRTEMRGLSQGPSSPVGGLILRGTPSDGAGDEAADLSSLQVHLGNNLDAMSVFTFTYPADRLPSGYGKPLTVKIQVDPSGADRIADKKTQAELERLYEMVAEARLAAWTPAAFQR